MTSRAIQALLLTLLGIFPVSQASGETDQQSAVTVIQPWARATPPVQPINGAAYMVIRNQSAKDIRVTGVTSPIAASLSLHRSETVEGQVRMLALPEGLAVPTGESVTLEPMGYHIMMRSLDMPLKAGESFALTLNFADQASVVVEVQILTESPQTDSHHSH
jgi:copper(I)-binding protein